jgi:predicted DNA-binding protein
MPANVATNIRLPEEVLKALKYKAIEENKSVNRLICEAIEMSLTIPAQPGKLAKDPFERVIGVAKSGIKDGSTKHDHYLYGKKK